MMSKNFMSYNPDIMQNENISLVDCMLAEAKDIGTLLRALIDASLFKGVEVTRPTILSGIFYVTVVSGIFDYFDFSNAPL